MGGLLGLQENTPETHIRETRRKQDNVSGYDYRALRGGVRFYVKAGKREAKLQYGVRNSC